MTQVTTYAPEQTIAFGRYIGERLQGGEVFAVTGPLGSGKTHWIKGIALGIDARELDEVNSPTFVLVNEYHGRLDVYHIDVYRLASASEFESLGFDDYLYPQAVVLIEWADKVQAALDWIQPIQVAFAHGGDAVRTIAMSEAPDYLEVRGFQNP